ncbi:MAG: helix-turn-helix domain-containing protein [Microcoleus sp.]
MVRLTKIQHQNIVNRYQAGELCSDLSREFGVDRSSVYELKRKGVQMQDKSYVFRKASGHYLDETVFETINNDSAYWIGFLLADGAIVDTTVALCLQDRDSFHLEKFRQFVAGTQSLIKVESTKSWRYAFQSRKVVNDLEAWGVTSRKSATATVHLDSQYPLLERCS